MRLAHHSPQPRWKGTKRMNDEVRRLRASLQAQAEDYEHVVNENGDLRRDNARLQGQLEALREHIPAEYEVRCPDCNALVAIERGENAVLARRDAVTFLCQPCSIRQFDPKWRMTAPGSFTLPDGDIVT